MLSRNELDKYYRYATSICEDKEDAYDLLHETIVKIASSGKDFKELKPGYIYLALRSGYIDWQRRDKKRNNEPFEETKVLDISSPSFDDILINRKEVAGLLEELESHERELLFLHIVEGYSTAEIAEMIETPKGTILARLHRIKKKIRTMTEAKASAGGEG